MASRTRGLDDAESLRRFVHSLSEGVYISTPDGRVLDGNPAFFAMMGVTSLDELGSVPDLLVDPSERKRELERLARDGAVRDFEIRIRRRDGEIRTVIDTAYVATDPGTGETVYHGILIDITDRKRFEEQLREQSLRDPLTGCFNRRFLSQFAEANDSGPGSWGCLVADVDHFKAYNDEHGHAAGDAILTRLSRFLMRQLRAEEFVVRTGGDEFVVLLPGADEPGTFRAAERLREAALGDRLVPFSMGWAARHGTEPLERTLLRADRRMIQVKSSGPPSGLISRRQPA